MLKVWFERFKNKSMSQILFSFIIPRWNSSNTICYCLDSILSQFESCLFEIIVVDDASTDESVSIVEEIIGDDFRCRFSESVMAQYMPKTSSLFKNIGVVEEISIRSRLTLIRLDRNKGVANARNHGIKKANGKYIWFVDSDDIIANNSLEILKNIITNDVTYDIIRFKSNLYRKVPQIFTAQLANSTCIKFDLEKNDDLLIMLRGGVVTNRVFNREFISTFNFNDKYIYCEDSHFAWLTTLNARIMGFVNESLYGYIWTPDSLTTKRPFVRFKCNVKVVEDFMTIIYSSSRCDHDKYTLIRECERRFYLHAFRSYNYKSITPEMWNLWYKIYANVMINNKLRPLYKRMFSKLLYIIHYNRIFVIIYTIIYGKSIDILRSRK